MPKTVFFSWQSDTPAKIGRSFVESAINLAIAKLNDEIELEEADREGEPLEIDKDTKGVAGSPPIVDTIFNKITAASAFIGDVTFSGRRLNDHPTPNPNVLIEYGWALRALSYNRVICLMNTAFGDPKTDELPFDMRHLRHPIPYTLKEDATRDEKKAAEKSLVHDLVNALRPVLALVSQNETPPSLPFQGISSAETPGRFRLISQPLGQSEPHFLREPVELTMPVGPVFWLRLMPKNKQLKDWALSELKLAAAGPGGNRTFNIFGWSSTGDIGYLRSMDGFGMYPVCGEGPTVKWLSYIFRSGEIWGIDLATPNIIASSIYLFEALWTKALRNYLETLTKLGVSGPYVWIAGMEGTTGRRLETEGLGPIGGRCVADQVVKSGNIAGTEIKDDALIPFFEEVYDMCGLVRPTGAQQLR